MPTAHCISTTNGVILAADSGFCALVGRPEKDVIGATYRELTHPDDIEKSARMLATLIDRAPPLRLQKRYVRPNGVVVPALLFVTCFADADQLISTLFWHEAGAQVRPERLWEAALRIQHVDSVRRAAFGDRLMTDPVGDLLVVIYLAEAEGRVIGLEELALQTGIAPSTTERWIRVLQERDIIRSDGDIASDVHLTQRGLLNMERTLESVFQLPRSLSDSP